MISTGRIFDPDGTKCANHKRPTSMKNSANISETEVSHLEQEKNQLAR